MCSGNTQWVPGRGVSRKYPMGSREWCHMNCWSSCSLVGCCHVAVVIHPSQACQDVHADPNILEGVDAAEATDPCLAGLCRHKLGAIRLGHMQHLLRYLRLSLSYVRQMDNSAVLQFRCGDKREHVLVGHSMALSNAARASLCLSLHVLCVCQCMFSLCLSLHVLTICKSLRN